MAEIPMRYKCGNCGDLHDDVDDARGCCTPSISEVFVCPLCFEAHDTEIDARDCCGVDASFILQPTAAELEAAGQLRLPL